LRGDGAHGSVNIGASINVETVTVYLWRAKRKACGGRQRNQKRRRGISIKINMKMAISGVTWREIGEMACTALTPHMLYQHQRRRRRSVEGISGGSTQ